jgi:hypothetical protein
VSSNERHRVRAKLSFVTWKEATKCKSALIASIFHVPDREGASGLAWPNRGPFATKPLGVNRAFAGKGVPYFSRLISKAAQSRLARIIAMPVYQKVTIRNWNKTTKLLLIMEAARATNP